MPLIRIDYSQKLLSDATLDTLVRRLLQESMRIYEASEDQVSIFCSSYGKHGISTAAAEIEVRAKISRYEKLDITPDELRRKHIVEYSALLKQFIADHKIQKNIAFTITFEDWQVAWIPGYSRDE